MTEPHAAPGLFVGVDRALFVAALADRLRRAGLPAPLSAVTRCAAAVEAVGPMRRDDLYWVTRLSFVSHQHQIPLFDRVFAALFDAGDALRSKAARGDSAAQSTGDSEHARRIEFSGAATAGTGLPWATRPPVIDDADDDESETSIEIPELRPSTEATTSDTPFDLLDPDELVRIGALLESRLHRWPTRRSRRRERHPSGRTPELRSSLRRSLRTGGEPIRLDRSRPRTRPRRVVVLVDVSGSMESFARAYLHVTRALVMSGRAEVFAFSTELTRITPSLRHRSAVEAIDRASDDVGDRFGGTRLAGSLATLLGHPRWKGLVRGSVVVIASDGWDTDPPERIAATMAKLDRLAHRIVWVNPRAAAPDYQPLVGAMAAALPHCDAFVSGHSLAAMDDLLAAITTP